MCVGVFVFHCVIIRCCLGEMEVEAGVVGRGKERVMGMYVVYIYCVICRKVMSGFRVSWMYLLSNL